MILVGAGNLGRAIATHMSFQSRGFELIGIFDKKSGNRGEMIKIFLFAVLMLDDFVKKIFRLLLLFVFHQAKVKKLLTSLCPWN